MKKNLVTLLLAALMVFSVTCALGDGASIAVTDMYGREITLSAPADRIVALTAADCEILCALGGEDMLVGRGAYCDEPASILDVPVVESGAQTNIEQIIALAPQVVLMGDMAQSAQQVQALESAGIQVAVSNADDIEGTYEAIRMIGALTAKNDEAEALVAGMQATFGDIAAKSENNGKTVYFEVSPLQWGLWTAGSGTFMDELAALCGLTNAFADVEGWGEISEEQVLARNPDYIVTITPQSGEGQTPEEEIMSRAGWETIEAVADGKVLSADSDIISRPGPRLVEAAKTLFDFVSAPEK